jgi:hypothetical protein
MSYYVQSNPRAQKRPLIGCPRFHIQYIRSYLAYMEHVSSIRNLRARKSSAEIVSHDMDCRLRLFAAVRENMSYPLVKNKEMLLQIFHYKKYALNNHGKILFR